MDSDSAFLYLNHIRNSPACQGVRRLKAIAVFSVGMLLASSLFLTPVFGQSPIRYVSSINVYQGDAVGSMSNLQVEDTKRIIITEEDLYPDNDTEYDLRIEALPLQQNNSFQQ